MQNQDKIVSTEKQSSCYITLIDIVAFCGSKSDNNELNNDLYYYLGWVEAQCDGPGVPTPYKFCF